MSIKYVIITPAKNEGQYIEHTLESVVNQTVLPVEWIIVDDGSDDNTCDIIKHYAGIYPWIKCVRRNSENEIRDVGSKVIQVFNYGLNYITFKDFDFIVKLDGDLVLPSDYFESVAKEFKRDLRLGLCGGFCVNLINGVERIEKSASYHIRGAFKAVRKECWVSTGGFRDILGWDGLDEMEAMFNGWKTKVIQKKVIHLRPTGNAYHKRQMAFRLGYCNYKNGGNFALFVIRFLKRLLIKPYILYGIYFLSGFISAFLKKENKDVSPDLAIFINKFHFRRITEGIFGTLGSKLHRKN